jgi:hypothetical protein
VNHGGPPVLTSQRQTFDHLTTTWGFGGARTRSSSGYSGTDHQLAGDGVGLVRIDLVPGEVGIGRDEPRQAWNQCVLLGTPRESRPLDRMPK